MQKNSILTAASLIVLAFAFQTATAQITINIPNLPKIPKIKKPKVDQPQQESPTPDQPKMDQPTDNGKTSDEPKKSEPSTVDCDKLSGVAYAYLEDINKTLKEAKEFRPGRSYYVSELSDRKNKYFEAALLPGERKEFAENWKGSPEYAKCLEPALDELAAVARKTLPTYTGPTGYTLGTPAEKKVLQSAISDIAQAKVLRVGLQQANWMIAKDEYNFPTARYKYGSVLLKYPNSEFCWHFWINLVQDYAGGGTYGASYGNYIARSLAGCPAGK
jgi:hypothetical protein